MQIKRSYRIKQKSGIIKFRFVFEKNEFKIQLLKHRVNIFDLLLIKNQIEDQIINSIYSIYENKLHFFMFTFPF